MGLFALLPAPALCGPILTLVLSLTAYALYRYYSQPRPPEEETEYDLPKLLDILRQRVQQNLEMVRSGNVGWRRVAWGRTRIDLLPLLPPEEDRGKGAFGKLEKRFPALMAEMAIADERRSRLRRAADNLAERLEGPVKERSEKEAVRALRDNEENWLLMLRQLINNEAFFDELAARYQQYWQNHRESYMRTLKAHGGRALEELGHLREELVAQYRGLLQDIAEARQKLTGHPVATG